jgi:hypothetical protein
MAALRSMRLPYLLTQIRLRNYVSFDLFLKTL